MKINNLRAAASALALVALSAAGSAHADTLLTYDLSHVTFSDGASASGDFVFDATTDKITAWNITVSAGSEKLGHSSIAVPAQTFSSSSGGSVAYTGAEGQDFLFYGNSSGKDVLNLAFSTSLLSAPRSATLNALVSADALVYHGIPLASGLSGRSAGVSLVGGAPIAPVPEPSAVTLMLAGALVVGATLRRRSKSLI